MNFNTTKHTLFNAAKYNTESDAKTKDGPFIWTSEKVNQIIEQYSNGEIDIRELKNSPFVKNDIDTRKPNLLFQYTPEELEELEKCKASPLYFAEHYAFAMTNNGLQLLKYRPYQKAMITELKNNNKCIIMAARQIGKCHLFDTQLVIKNIQTNSLSKIPFFELYFNELQKTRKLTIFENLKWKLYKIRYLLSTSQL